MPLLPGPSTHFDWAACCYWVFFYRVFRARCRRLIYSSIVADRLLLTRRRRHNRRRRRLHTPRFLLSLLFSFFIVCLLFGFFPFFSLLRYLCCLLLSGRPLAVHWVVLFFNLKRDAENQSERPICLSATIVSLKWRCLGFLYLFPECFIQLFQSLFLFLPSFLGPFIWCRCKSLIPIKTDYYIKSTVGSVVLS